VSKGKRTVRKLVPLTVSLYPRPSPICDCGYIAYVSYGGVPLSTADCAAAAAVSGQRRALGGGRQIHGGYMRDERWEW